MMLAPRVDRSSAEIRRFRTGRRRQARVSFGVAVEPLQLAALLLEASIEEQLVKHRKAG